MRIKSFLLFILIFQKPIAPSADGLHQIETTPIPTRGDVSPLDLTTDYVPFYFSTDFEYAYYDEAGTQAYLNSNGYAYEDYDYGKYIEYASGEDIISTTGDDGLYKPETETNTLRIEISTTDTEHTIPTDLALESTTENAKEINGGIALNATTEQRKSANEQKWLSMESVILASACTAGGVVLTLAVIFLWKKLLNNHRGSNGEFNNRQTDGYDMTTMKENAKGNIYCIVVDETKGGLPKLPDRKSATQDSYAALTFINATNENAYLELVKQPTENEYDCVNENC